MIIVQADDMTGYALLHELFHVDELSKAGTQGHIKDLSIEYWHGQIPTWRAAYGPTFTKVLARWDNVNVGKFVVTNGM